MRPLTLIAVLTLVAVPVAAGASQTAEVARLRAEFRDERARARSLREDARQAAAEIVALERDLARLGADGGDDDPAIAAQRTRLRELGAREAALVARLSEARGRQGRLLSALQMMSRRPPPPLLVPADQAVDTVRAAILMQAMAPALQARAQGLADRQAEVARLRRLSALDSERLFTTESDRGDRHAAIEALSARKTALRAVLNAEAGAAERATRALEARLRSLGAAVPAMDAEAEPAAARLPAGRNRLTSPVAGPPSQRFGPASTGWRWRGDALEARSPAGGRVSFAGPISGWGQVVILDLGPGWRAVVSGLEELAVETGARVSDGQTLGQAGDGGEVAFELRRDERPIDPAPWLR